MFHFDRHGGGASLQKLERLPVVDDHDHDDGTDPNHFVAPNDGTAENGLPIYDWNEAAAELTRSGATWSTGLGTATTVTFAFRNSINPSNLPGDTSQFSQFSADQITATLIALQLWSDVANITFVRSQNPGSQYSNNASILFANYGAGEEGAAAFAFYPGSRVNSSVDGDVWVNISLAENQINWSDPSLVWGEYGLHTLTHEIGHAIGISHPGDYDGGDPTYPEAATYWQDSRAYTVMSYFGSGGVGHNLNAFAAGPQLHDIAAAQRLYGANMTTRTGDTIYGWNSNTGSEHFDINTLTEGVVFAVWDAGGIDTFDFSGYSSNSEIDLREEFFSSVGPGNGVTGDFAIGNVAIARGVTIENAIGGSGNDTIFGNAANNILDGGAGVDTLTGGLGNDTYIVDVAGDTIVELAGQGTDTVQAAVTYTLVADLENLTLTGVGNINGTGNTGANVINGNSGDNVLNGGGGTDTLTGGAGNDTYVVDGAEDTIVETAGQGTDTVQAAASFTLAADLENLTLTGVANINGTGNTGANVINGNSGDNILNGGGGTDTLSGGAGNDTYIVDGAEDTIVESGGQGTDTVQASFSYTLAAELENLTLIGVANINGTGNSVSNQITGNSGDNVLDGGGAADTLAGGAGNDTYFIDALDSVTELADQGTDIVNAAFSYTLGDNVEQLVLTGSDNLNGTGNAGVNRLTGNAGNNALNGLAGADTMIGGLGDDTYVVDDANDVVTEAASAGTDNVQASATHTLSANVENLTLTGGGAINGRGNTGNNTITGNGAVNSLFGFEGDDILDGGAGADSMFGAQGNDTYYVDNASDTTLEGQFAWGTDLVYASVTYTLGLNIDNLTLTGGSTLRGNGNEIANVITGNGAVNVLYGYAGDDTLNGAAGADKMYGGEGTDTYYIDNAADFLFEAQFAWGTDTAYTNVSYELGLNIDNLVLQSGAGAIFGRGNEIDNAITGNESANNLYGFLGNDVLNGGAGADKMYGAQGDDTYFVDHAGDIAFEAQSGWGTDTVYSSLAAYELGANVDNLIIVGAGLNGRGNGDANTITGNNLDNRLNGLVGDDTLIGGVGNDILIGAAGDDHFIFALGDGDDTINDFVAGGTDDAIDLSAYDGSGVTWTVDQAGANTVFNFSNGDSITLLNVNSANLVYDGLFGYS